MSLCNFEADVTVFFKCIFSVASGVCGWLYDTIISFVTYKGIFSVITLTTPLNGFLNFVLEIVEQLKKGLDYMTLLNKYTHSGGSPNFMLCPGQIVQIAQCPFLKYYYFKNIPTSFLYDYRYLGALVFLVSFIQSVI
jgi:hypothetical protein